MSLPHITVWFQKRSQGVIHEVLDTAMQPLYRALGAIFILRTCLAFGRPMVRHTQNHFTKSSLGAKCSMGGTLDSVASKLGNLASCVGRIVVQCRVGKLDRSAL